MSLDATQRCGMAIEYYVYYARRPHVKVYTSSIWLQWSQPLFLWHNGIDFVFSLSHPAHQHIECLNGKPGNSVHYMLKRDPEFRSKCFRNSFVESRIRWHCIIFDNWVGDGVSNLCVCVCLSGLLEKTRGVLALYLVIYKKVKCEICNFVGYCWTTPMRLVEKSIRPGMMMMMFMNGKANFWQRTFEHQIFDKLKASIVHMTFYTANSQVIV